MTNKTGIALAEEVRNIAKDSMFDEEILINACQLLDATGNADSPELNQLLFKYSANLVSTVAAKLTTVLLTESQISGMIADIKMFQDIGNEVGNG